MARPGSERARQLDRIEEERARREATPLADALGAPIEREFNGSVLTLHPLQARDWGVLDRWVREEFLRSALAAADALPAGQAQADYTREALREASGLSVLNEHVLTGLLSSIPAMCRILWLSARHEPKNAEVFGAKRGLELEDVEAAFSSDLTTLANLVGDVLTISLPQEAVPVPPAGKGKKRKRARRSSTGEV